MAERDASESVCENAEEFSGEVVGQPSVEAGSEEPGATQDTIMADVSAVDTEASPKPSVSSEGKTLHEVVAEAIGVEELEMLAMDTSESAPVKDDPTDTVVVAGEVDIAEGTILTDGGEQVIILQHEGVEELIQMEEEIQAPIVEQGLGESASVDQPSELLENVPVQELQIDTGPVDANSPSDEVTATEVALNVLPDDDDMEYDMDEPALLLTDKGKLYICIYCGTVSVFVSQLRTHLRTCRLKNPDPALEIPTLETILCRINDKLKRISSRSGGSPVSNSNGLTEEEREDDDAKEQIIRGIVDRAIDCMMKKSEKKKRSCQFCARIFYSQNSLKKHMEEQCDLRPSSSSEESDSDSDVGAESSGEDGNLDSDVPCMPLTVLPLGEPCACDHREEFTRAAGMLIEKLLKKTNEVYFQGSCGNIFKVEAGTLRPREKMRETKRKEGKTRDSEGMDDDSEDEVDENGHPCGKFPCPLCKVVLQEAVMLDEHLMQHMSQSSSAECNFCGKVLPAAELHSAERWN